MPHCTVPSTPEIPDLLEKGGNPDPGGVWAPTLASQKTHDT
jgi:hypothetical protein